MSYADQKMSSGRITAIIIVAALHAVLGYAFVTGLAYNVVKQVAQDLKTFDVTEEPPPPEELPPPPPEEVVMEPPPVVSPPPIVRTNVIAPPIVRTVREAPPVVITPTAPPAPPPPPQPKREAVGAKPRSNPGSWATNADYPSSALRNEEEGTTGFRVTVGTNGRVTDCSVTSSSGSSTLDEATCRLITRRARFTPAEDSNGNPITDTYSNRIRWQIPED
ncbi:energy transducer TonB [Allosphingosinicella sp.]|uniref:energy transducer TonB n=1 Tax=Allosphingosinicella sp. TaxID=2823234 RepID=UPI002FC0BB17